jgi:hypothetical protein
MAESMNLLFGIELFWTTKSTTFGGPHLVLTMLHFTDCVILLELTCGAFLWIIKRQTILLYLQYQVQKPKSPHST